MVAIENRPGPYHVRPRLRPRYDCRAVRQVHDAGINSQSPQPLKRGIKPFFLFAGLLSNEAFCENSRRSKMRKNARQLNVLALSELPREALYVSGRDSQPVHPGINLQMERYVPLSATAR